MRADRVLGLACIRRHVVEFRRGRCNVLPPGGAQAMQRRPSEMPAQERFNVGGFVIHPATVQGGPQRTSIDRLRKWHTREIEQRRQDVDAAGDDVLHAALTHLRTRDNPGHPERRVVHEHTVRLLPVIAETLAVIGRHEHECGGAGAHHIQVSEQAANLLVDDTILRRSRAPGKTRQPLGRRCVCGVRIEIVHPQEPRSARVLAPATIDNP